MDVAETEKIVSHSLKAATVLIKGYCHRDFAVFSSFLCKNHCIVPLLTHKMLVQNYKENIK